MNLKLTIYLIISVIVFYVMIAGLRYRFAHPEKTQPQVILEIKDVLLWK
jgi:hypothetical protein